MYRTALTSVGFVPTTQSTQSDDDQVVTAQAFDIPGTTSDVAELVVLTIDGDADYIELQLDDATTADSFGLCSVVATFTALAPGASPQSCGAQSGGDELQLDAEFVVARRRGHRPRRCRRRDDRGRPHRRARHAGRHLPRLQRQRRRRRTLVVRERVRRHHDVVDLALRPGVMPRPRRARWITSPHMSPVGRSVSRGPVALVVAAVVAVTGATSLAAAAPTSEHDDPHDDQHVGDHGRPEHDDHRSDIHHVVDLDDHHAAGPAAQPARRRDLDPAGVPVAVRRRHDGADDRRRRGRERDRAPCSTT